MRFMVSKTAPQSCKADIIAIGCYEREQEEGEAKRRPALIKHADGGIALDKALGGTLSKQVQGETFRGERGEHRLFFTAGRIPARFILLTGLGRREKCDLEVLREAGAQMAHAAREVHAASVSLVLERGPVGDDTAPARARAIAEGVLLGGYRFERYKTGEHEAPSHATTTFLYQGDAAPVREAIAKGQLVAAAQLHCRDLVNTPACDATPASISQKAMELASETGLVCHVWGTDAIRKARMQGVLSIARGSAEAPAFVVVQYRPKEKPRASVVLVGKGVTFDAGGISLKPPRGMEAMKGDMAGAATALYAMEAIARLSPPVEVTAYLPLVENLPDGKAIKPGDVITARNGKTIEIISTDAEGRLLLADALAYAAESKPDAIIDLATLTGGAAYCCGELYSIAIGNDQRLIDRMRRAAEATGERVWQLPLVEEYRKGYTSGIADLNNTGKGKAQTILGAVFLKEFVGDVPWVHLDIAASSWTDEDLPFSPKGATGAPLRTIVDFVVHFKRGVTE